MSRTPTYIDLTDPAGIDKHIRKLLRRKGATLRRIRLRRKIEYACIGAAFVLVAAIVIGVL